MTWRTGSCPKGKEGLHCLPLKGFTMGALSLPQPFYATVLKVAFLIGTKWAGLGQSCPLGCFCLFSSVNCEKKGLDNVPRTVPLNTRELILSNNYFKEIPALQMGYYYELVILDCSYNMIEIDAEASFPALDKLTYLDLSHNQLSTISAYTFSQLTRLAFLNISHNPMIKKMDEAAFSQTPLLAYIDVAYCNVEIIAVKTFESLKNLRSLAIMGNPFDCNCTFLEFHSWLRQKPTHAHGQMRPRVQLVESENVICKKPRSVSGLQIFEAENKIHHDCLLHVKPMEYIYLGLISFSIFILGTMVAGMIGITTVIYHHPVMKVDDELDQEGEYRI